MRKCDKVFQVLTFFFTREMVSENLIKKKTRFLTVVITKFVREKGEFDRSFFLFEKQMKKFTDSTQQRANITLL